MAVFCFFLIHILLILQTEVHAQRAADKRRAEQEVAAAKARAAAEAAAKACTQCCKLVLCMLTYGGSILAGRSCSSTSPPSASMYLTFTATLADAPFATVFHIIIRYRVVGAGMLVCT